MNLVQLVHWNESEAAEKATVLKKIGYQVNHSPFTKATLKELKQNQPSAIIIDLSRIPSQGRDAAMALRSYKSTRNIPIIFVGGEQAKVSKIKAQLPDAEYSDWGRIQETIDKAIKRTPSRPFKARTRLEGYSGVPLTKKLGINPGTTIALIAPPDGFRKKLGKLPRTVSVHRDVKRRPGLIIWFTRTSQSLERDTPRMVQLAQKGAGLWIAWPKKSSGENSDLSETVVRKLGLEAGLVDYKIIRIDSTWSGLRFTTRKPARHTSVP